MTGAEVTDCACTPGTEENGWHENRCDACIAAELQVWRDMFAWLRGEGRLA